MPTTAEISGPFSYSSVTFSSSPSNNYDLVANKTKFEPSNGETIQVYLNGTLLAGDGTKGSSVDALAASQLFYVDNVTTPTKVHLTTPNHTITSGTVLIKRISNRSTAQVDFAPGSVIREQDLDSSTNQTLHVAQEAMDIALQGIVIGADNKWDASTSSTNRVIKNVANPASANDAVNKTYLEDTWLTATDKTNSATVAGISTEIGRLGTTAAVADMAILGTDAVVADMAILGSTTVTDDMAILGSTTVTDDMALLAVSSVITDMDLLGASGVIADMDALGATGVIEDMALLATAAVVEDMSILGTSAVVADLAILGTSDVVTDMNVLATSDVVADMNVLATSDVVADMNVLGTADVVADMNVLGTSDVVTDMNLLGVSAVIADMALLAVPAVITDMDLLGASGVIADMDLLGASGVIADMDAIGATGVIADLETVANNLSSINDFADKYRIASSAPSSNNDDGDLYYNTATNQLNVHDGSAWGAIGQTEAQSIVTADNSATAMAIALG
jgi:hypothetical protein